MAAPSTAVAPAEALALAVRLAEGLYLERDAPATRRAYSEALRDFERAMTRLGMPVGIPAPPEAVTAYLGDLAARGAAVATVRVRLAGLRRAHTDRGVPSPTEHPAVRSIVRGYTRAAAGAPRKRAQPLSGPQVRAAIVHPRTPRRDRAILAVGFVGGLRRSELAGLTWGDVRNAPTGATIQIGRSKTDQDGRGAVVGLPYSDDPAVCPVRLLGVWRREVDPHADPRVFGVRPAAISAAVKRAAHRIGLDPQNFSAHSLRAGLATCAAEAGVALAESMLATRHRSADVAASYVRQNEALTNAAHRAAVEALGRG